MKQNITRIIGIAAITGFLFAAVGDAHSQQSPLLASTLGTLDEAANQLVQVGQAATFSVIPVNGASYQWVHNGLAITGQTGSTLNIADAVINDAGFYSCTISTGANVVPSVTASLMVFAPDDLGLGIVVYAAPITSSGSSGSCPGKYTGYVNYILPVPTWGYAPSTNTTLYTASDTNRTNTKVAYVGAYGDYGCNLSTVTIPYPTTSPAYRFTIYFTNNVPSTNYSILLNGFNP